MGKKLNILLQKWPHGGIITAGYLESLGIYKQLRKKYINSCWIESLGYGAFKRSGDAISWEGALNAIQNQDKKLVHIGGKTALELQGYAHFIPLNETRLILFSSNPLKLPKWFLSQQLGIRIDYHSSSFLRTDEGIESIKIKGFDLRISSPERAIFETLFLVPHSQSIQESKYLMENLRTLRPQIVQNLLENCASFKVKRLFLLIAQHENLPCLRFINLKNINLGIGNRSLIKGGILDKQYKITIPKDLFSYES